MKTISTDVKLKTQGSKRSPKWARVRKAHLKANPRCAVCNSKKKLEAHHIIPFHMRPDLELDRTNLITMCESKKTLNCHLIVGHFGNYKKINPEVRRDAKYFLDAFQSKIIVVGQ